MSDTNIGEVKVTDAVVTEDNTTDKVAELQQAKVKQVSEDIQKVLEAGEMALQPFMMRSEFGDRPSVRLVDVSSTLNDEQTTDSTKENQSETTDELTATA